ncbi:phosphodiesterase [Pseudoflavonifractor sp. MSJ-37]|uniref:phosphodiesterase n=1 Tax=Pseudoflavonifractor sp. MSJ-37 TaxID=2841531 RepID=UPI001C10E6E4|nr:phosphodiesterase [Pseudoflavonifractor sp. MSJ-37]MBU5434580.1 phosphodiesterase [Pseudoflavonifractor sp. MSJ-37]
MKWLIASDLHGSAYWTRRLLDAYRAEGAGRLLLLGDLLYHGPRNDLPREYAPKEVIALLSPLADRIFCVRGNCEAEVDQMVLPFPVMADYALLEQSGHLIFATHGHQYNLAAPPKLQPGDVLLHGHTHVPACVETGTFSYLDPGSVSIPKEDSPHSCMTLEDGLFRWLDLEDGSVFRVWSLDGKEDAPCPSRG